MDYKNLKHETNIYSDIYGPVHTGSGSIYVSQVVYQGQIVKLSEEEQNQQISEYFSWQSKSFALLPLFGIPLPLDVDIPLEQVYIKLRALPQERKKEEFTIGSPLMEIKQAIEFVKQLGELQWQKYQETISGHLLMDRHSKASVSPEQAIMEHKKVVIIGAPGSGKSTLLRHIVWDYAKSSRFPVTLFIPLGRVDQLMLQRGWSLLGASLEILTAHKTGMAKAQLQRALNSLIESKKVRFLFDAMDEVYTNRRHIFATLTALAEDDHSVVVTSRPVGYERLYGFAHYEVLSLLPEDAHAFMVRWFNSLTVARGDKIDHDKDWFTERACWLKKQLDTRPSIREISRIPLLLTFLTILASDESNTELPRFRKNLYKDYIERLFVAWEARRKSGGAFTLGETVGKKASVLALWGLYNIGYFLHTIYYGDGTNKQPKTQDVEKLLSDEISHHWKIEPLEAAGLSQEILNFWEEAGLLIKYEMRGQKIFAFRHLTFQEYSVSRVLADMPLETVWDIVQKNISSPQWREAILLTLAQLDMQTCTQFIGQLLDEDATDHAWHQRLNMVGNLLAEGAALSEPVRRTTIDRLINLAQLRLPWSVNEINAATLFTTLSKLETDSYCLALLLSVARNERLRPVIRVLSADAVGRMGRIDEATATLLQISQTCDDIPTQIWIANILAQLERRDIAKEIISSFSMSCVPAAFKGAIAEVLALIGEVSESSIFLQNMAEDLQQKPVLRLEAVKALLRLKQTERANSLLQSLINDKTLDAHSRIELAKMLKQTGLHEEFEKALANIVSEEHTNISAKLDAIEELCLENRHQEYIADVFTIARNEQFSDSLRARAIELLVHFDIKREIVDWLFLLARDQKIPLLLREKASNCLSRSGFEEGEQIQDNIKNEIKTLPFSKHLKELLECLILPVLTVGGLTGITYLLFSSAIAPILAFLYNRVDSISFIELISSARLLISFQVSFLITWPLFVYQIYGFVKPGLLFSEKPIVRRIAIGVALILSIYTLAILVFLSRFFTVFFPRLSTQEHIYWLNRITITIAVGTLVILVAKSVRLGVLFAQIQLYKRVKRRLIAVGIAVGIAISILLLLLPLWIWPLSFELLLLMAITVLLLANLRKIWLPWVSSLSKIYAIKILESLSPYDPTVSSRGTVLGGRSILDIYIYISARQAKRYSKTIKASEVLSTSESQANIPDELRWFLTESDSHNLDITLAIDHVRILGNNAEAKSSYRIRAARALMKWGYRDEAIKILRQIALDCKQRFKARCQAIKIIVQEESKQAIEVLENIVKDEDIPKRHRIEALEIFVKETSKEQAILFLNDLTKEQAVNHGFRRTVHTIKRRLLEDVPVNLSSLRTPLLLVWGFQFVVFIAISLLFSDLATPILHKLYNISPTIVDYCVKSRLTISIDIALFIFLPLYILVVFIYVRPILDLSEERKIITLIVIGGMLLYPISVLSIFFLTHIDTLSILLTSLEDDNVRVINQFAILPFAIFIWLFLTIILPREVEIIEKVNKKISIFAFILPSIPIFLLLLLPIWIFSVLLTISIAIAIDMMGWIIDRDPQLT